MKEVLEFIFESPYHYFGFLIMMGIVSTWRLLNIDITVIGKVKDDEQGDRNK